MATNFSVTEHAMVYQWLLGAVMGQDVQIISSYFFVIVME